MFSSKNGPEVLLKKLKINIVFIKKSEPERHHLFVSTQVQKNKDFYLGTSTMKL